MTFWGGKLKGWFDKVKKNSHMDQIISTNNYQNAVFVSEALLGEIMVWNNQIFEEGYMSHPKYLGSTVWFNIQLVPKLYLCDLLLSSHYEPKCTMKVKVIKYFLQIFVIWNNGAGKKWGARYTFWYIVLLTLCNGDKRMVHCVCKKWNWNMSKYKVVRSSPNEEPGFAGNNREGPLRKIPLKAIKTALALQLEMSMRLRIMRFHADMRFMHFGYQQMRLYFPNLQVSCRYALI